MWRVGLLWYQQTLNSTTFFFKMMENWWSPGTWTHLQNCLIVQGESRPDGAHIHKYLRNLVLNHFGVESLKANLLPQLEDLACPTLRAWSSQESVEVKSAAATVSPHS